METIIIQDTDQDILNILNVALEMAGFQVYALSDIGPDFLQLIEKAKPHVVAIDYRLSGEDAKLCCREIKQRYPHLPVLACGSISRESATDHIPCPVPSLSRAFPSPE
jgi:DNA-binding response OmpR family regulator